MLTNLHDIVHNVIDLTDEEFESVKLKFFEIFGDDKNPDEIKVIDTERLEQRSLVRCRFQNNSFIVHLQN